MVAHRSMGMPSAEDKAAMRTFWRFYEEHRLEISARTTEAVARSSEWHAILAGVSPEQAARRDAESHALQAAAILEDRWDPYLASLRAQGAQYAAAGVSYAAWFDLVRAYRDGVREQLRQLLVDDPQRHASTVLAISQGMNSLIDAAFERIGEAYLDEKQRLIAGAEDRYRSMFEHSPTPMWTFDRKTRQFVMVNEAAVQHYGYSREELATMRLDDIRPPDDVAAMHEDVAHATGLMVGRTWRHRKKDGTIIIVEVRANDFTIAGRDVRLVIANDVTDRVKAEESLRKTEDQLRHAQKMEAVGRLAGSVAHDFNNMLTVVQGYASMLEDSIDPKDVRHEDAAEIRRAAERAAAITRQLLTLSQHSIVAPRAVDIDELVDGFLSIVRRLVGESIAVTAHRGGGSKVIADPGQLEQVLMNLAVNARDAMPSGGRLTIEAREVAVTDDTAGRRGLTPGRYVELAVTDTGTGIDRETQRRIFDPFFTTKEAGKGTGLGLSIVHGIVSQAGGAVSVYSELGHGTTFRVHLPVADGSVVPDETAETMLPEPLPPLHVLVVDDQADVRAVAARILQNAGCTVVEAATADEARRICVSHEEQIDLVLLDVVLPDERGDVVVEELRALAPKMTFVLTSGYPAGALTPTGSPPPNLLAKPFSPSELRAAVARAYRSARGAASPATGVGAAAGPARQRILIADDDALVRRALARVLAHSGFEIVEVDSGRKATAALGTASFDVVVSDVQMPDGGGLDLLRAVRRVDLDVPVILVTGDPSIAAAAEAVEYGAFRYLTKPLDTMAFCKLVGHAARAHALARLRRDAYRATGAHATISDRAGLEVRFDQAVAGMWMAFQPIVHADTGAPFGVEALMRSNEPSIPHPGALLDAAAQLGRLPLLGRRVRELSSAAYAARVDDVALFVNLHPEDLDDIDLIAESAPLSRIASRVVLEVTERSSLERCTGLTERVARLRQMGFRLAVDDIGAGYSGLTSFTELMPEIVKIDMSLVRDVHKSALKQRTIGALCRLCRDVGTLVVGEGVETLEERDALVELGCDLLQGYLIGRPARP